METLNPNPSTEGNPYRVYVLAVKLCILGAISFTAFSFLLHQNHPESGAAPLLNIKGYTVCTAALVECLETVYLLIMACILGVFYRRANKRHRKQQEEYKAQLKQELRGQKHRETKLEHAIKDLERFNAMAMGREQRILELKTEINNLLQEQDRPKRYNAAPAE